MHLGSSHGFILSSLTECSVGVSKEYFRYARAFAV